MILNASGRTDICAFYSKWFHNRLKAGFFDVRNPFYPRSISRIYMEDVDMIMFCTKNPIPLLSFIDEIEVPILLDVTVTPYHKEMEPGVPDKDEILKAMEVFSQKLGKEHITLRYDPVFLSKRYDVAYHVRAFEKLCSRLEGVVDEIVISFLDEYKNVKKNKEEIGYQEIQPEQYEALAKGFLESSKKHGIRVQTCYEKGLLKPYGIDERGCLSIEKAYDLTGKVFKKWKARDCGCVEMADIGVYNTCMHRCRYCYANYDEERITKQMAQHNPDSSLLIGEITPLDEVKVRRK